MTFRRSLMRGRCRTELPALLIGDGCALCTLSGDIAETLTAAGIRTGAGILLRPPAGTDLPALIDAIDTRLGKSQQMTGWQVDRVIAAAHALLDQPTHVWSPVDEAEREAFGQGCAIDRNERHMSSAAPAITIQGLVKKFGSFTALDDLDLEVAHGEVHGFLGPNGAGKSTTIRVLLGLLRANAGFVQLLGGDPWRDVVQLHRRLAYVPGDVVLWPGLSGGEAIDLLGNLRGGLNQKRRADLIERFELDPTKRGRQYSKGNRQKVAIVAALAADVDLLILDEPTSGLDPLMEAVFQDEVGKEKAKGSTILLSSHILSQVEVLADRVSIIRQGHMVQTGTLEDLRSQSRVTINATLVRPPADLATLNVLHDATLDERNRLTATVEPGQVNAAMAELVPHEMSALSVSPASLEDLFLRLYADEAQPDEADGGSKP